jgi:hypothetical protein
VAAHDIGDASGHDGGGRCRRVLLAGDRDQHVEAPAGRLQAVGEDAGVLAGEAGRDMTRPLRCELGAQGDGAAAQVAPE